MLKRFRVSNFKSLLNVEFKPVGLNLLIGPNNAGKTNLCSALRFLSRTSFEPLEMAAWNAIGETWNIPNAYVSDSTMEFETECSLVVNGEDLNYSYSLKIDVNGSPSVAGSGLRVVAESLLASGGQFTHVPLLSSANGQARLLNEERLTQHRSQDPYLETSAPTESSMLSCIYNYEANRHAHVFKEYLQSWDYYSLNPTSLRAPTVIRDIGAEFLSDGRNLSHVFFGIHNSNPRLEKRIIAAVKEVESKLDFLAYNAPDPESVYLFMEDDGGNRFSTQSISDGTLRFMAMTYLIFAAAESRNRGLPPALTIIEEPENGLYVGHLKPLIERIDPSGENGQFIFTTHSPYFIDLFDDNLDGLHLMKPGRPSSVLVKPDPQKISAMLEKMPLGEMHFREMLG
jgi:predicted ATPase